MPRLGSKHPQRLPAPEVTVRGPATGPSSMRSPRTSGKRGASGWRTLGGWLIFLGLGWLVFVFVGLRFFPVLTGSMVPAFDPGDLVVTVSPRIVAPEIGRVVVATPFFAEGGDQLPPIAHRIIDTQEGGWKTQGDANPEPDGWIVRDQDISRVVVASIPMDFAQDPRWIAAIVGFGALVWLWPRGGTTPPAALGPRSPTQTPLRRRAPGQAAHAKSGKHRAY